MLRSGATKHLLRWQQERWSRKTANALTQACPTPPAAPSNLTAQGIRVFIVHLTWTDNSNNEDGFKISRCLDLLCDEILVGANVTTYDDRPCSGGGGQPREGATLSSSTTYAYCVKAYNQGGESACSNTVEATVDCGSITPTGLESTSPSLVSGAVDGAATQAGTLTTRSFAPLPNGETHRSYYSFNGQRVAMRQVDAGGEDVLYLLGDHLGSTSLVLDAGGAKVAEARYYPYGQERWSSGTLPTDYRFTGQRQLAGLGLYQMGARFYDPYLNRFVQPDTTIPDSADPQTFNRYSYTNNSPLNYIDPSGHVFIIPPGSGNPVKFEPHKLGSTGVKVLDALGQAAIMVGCGLLRGVCKVEGEVGNARLVSTPDAEFVANSLTSSIMGLAMVDVSFPGASIIDTSATAAEGEASALVEYDPAFAYQQGANPQTVVPDNYVVVRGGQSPMPVQGATFSGSMGATVTEAASGVPHGSIRVTTAGAIREGGGIVELMPEPTRSGVLNLRHVNVVEGSATTFGQIIPNPVPKAFRMY